MKASRFLPLPVTLITIMMTSKVMTETTPPSSGPPSYDVDQVEDYTRLSEQLRNGLQDQVFDFVADVQSITGLPGEKRMEINSLSAEATSILAERWQDIFDLALAVGIRYTSAVKVYKNPVDIPGMPLFSIVKFDFTMNYVNDTGVLVFKKPGVYLMEFKAQSLPYTGSNTYIKFYRGSGTLKNNYVLYTDWEVTPYFEMLLVEPGDYMIVDGPNILSVEGGCHLSVHAHVHGRLQGAGLPNNAFPSTHH